MTQADIAFLGAMIRERSGIAVSSDKDYLFENRLAPILGQRRLDGVAALVTLLRSGRDEALARDVVEAMTTNETLFFRDGRPFDLLRTEILPALTVARQSSRTLRIWSAACSTGQEPYSLAMLLKEESARRPDWRIDIVATDIARSVLNKARTGIYSPFEVQRGLPIRLLVKYFRQVGSNWELDASIRNMVDFREHNITRDAPPLTCFDLIFCRNLLIYFEQDLKRRVLEKLAAALAPDGVLFLGGAESVFGLTDRLEPVPGQRGAYRVVSRTEAGRPRAAG